MFPTTKQDTRTKGLGLLTKEVRLTLISWVASQSQEKANKLLNLRLPPN